MIEIYEVYEFITWHNVSTKMHFINCLLGERFAIFRTMIWEYGVMKIVTNGDRGDGVNNMSFLG